MNHLESSFIGKNSLWRYLVMIATVFIIANTIGALPFIIAISVKSASGPEAVERLPSNPADLTYLGIDQIAGFAMMVFPFIVALVAYMLLVRPLNYKTFKLTLNGTGFIRWDHILISGMVWLLLLAIYFIVFLKIDPDNFSINNTSSSLIFLAAVSMLLIPVQATFEEVIFRGYLMQGFTVLAKNRWIPVMMTSLLFGLMHSFNPEVEDFGFLEMIPQYILFGLIFGIVTILDDGIEAAIGAHAVNNIFLSIMVTHKSSVLQTPAMYKQHDYSPWAEFAGLLIMGVIFIVILKMVFGWKNYLLLFSKVEPSIPQIQTR